MKPHQEYAILHPLTPANPWGIDPGLQHLVSIGTLTANLTVNARGYFDGVAPIWSVILIPWNEARDIVTLSELTAEGRDWLRQLAVGVLDGVGEDLPHVIVCGSSILVSKPLTEDEIAVLPAEAKVQVEKGRAVTRAR